MRTRNRQRTRRNPEWSFDLLDRIWSRLQARVPEALMPIPEEAVVPVRSNPRVREYGSGHYGVVMPTRDPRWVFKLTTDVSEAHFINAIRNMGMRCSLRGICRYSAVYDVGERQPSRSSSGRTYAVWRESADIAGEDTISAFDGTPRATMAAQAWRRIAHTLDYLREVYAQGTNRALLEAKRALQDCKQNGMILETAEDLLHLLGKGIVVTDINLSNWGVVRRRPKVLTLIDPGMVVFLTPKAKAVATGIPLL